MSVRSTCRPSHEGKHNAFKQSSLFAHFSTLVPKFQRKHLLPVAFSRVSRSAVFMVLFVVFRSLFSCGVHVFIVFMLSSFPFVLIIISFIFPCHIVYLHLQWICWSWVWVRDFLYLRRIQSRMAQCGFQTVMRSGVQFCFPRFCHDFLT